jgi:hypothetical protein
MRKKMRIFVLTETDSTDYKWCYNETFFDKEKAQARMKEIYHEDVVEREDLVVKSEFNEMSASAEMVDGIFLAWNIKECDIQ